MYTHTHIYGEMSLGAYFKKHGYSKVALHLPSQCKAIWKRECKLTWREVGPFGHHDDEVVSDRRLSIKNSLSLAWWEVRADVAGRLPREARLLQGEIRIDYMHRQNIYKLYTCTKYL